MRDHSAHTTESHGRAPGAAAVVVQLDSVPEATYLLLQTETGVQNIEVDWHSVWEKHKRLSSVDPQGNCMSSMARENLPSCCLHSAPATRFRLLTFYSINSGAPWSMLGKLKSVVGQSKVAAPEGVSGGQPGPRG